MDRLLNEQMYQEAIVALEQALFDSKAELETGGGCDHSVGICACSLIRNIERIEGLLPKLKDAKTAAIVRKEVNEEWVKWGSELCPTHPNEYIPIAGMRKSQCYKCWQERKKEVGL